MGLNSMIGLIAEQVSEINGKKKKKNNELFFLFS